jgi:hypothetical protein
MLMKFKKGKEQPEQKSHFLPGAMRKTVGLSHYPKGEIYGKKSIL